jgi:hypothetical protein
MKMRNEWKMKIKKKNEKLKNADCKLKNILKIKTNILL